MAKCKNCGEEYTLYPNHKKVVYNFCVICDNIWAKILKCRKEEKRLEEMLARSRKMTSS